MLIVPIIIKWTIMKVLDNVTTTDSYVDSDHASFNKQQDIVILEILNTGSNALHFKILASNDYSNWYTLKVETSLAADGKTYETCTDPWLYFKFQVKSASAGNHTTVDAHVIERKDV